MTPTTEVDLETERAERALARATRAAHLAAIDWSTQPLGQVPDRIIAQALGVSRGKVGAVRRQVLAEVYATLDDAVFFVVSHYRVRLVEDIHAEVLGEYGEVGLEAVRDALVRLVEERRVALVTAELRADLDRPRKHRRAKGYIRYDSPFLWIRDGRARLLAMLAAAVEAAPDAPEKPERTPKDRATTNNQGGTGRVVKDKRGVICRREECTWVAVHYVHECERDGEGT